MRKVVLALALLVGFVSGINGQGTKSKDSDKPKTYGAPKVESPKKEPEKPKPNVAPKVDEPKKVYGSPKKEPEKPKTYGSGSKDPDPKTPKKVYGSGDKKPEPKTPDVTPPKTGPPIGKKPEGSKFDSKAAQEQKKAESKAKFTQASKPAPTYTDPKGKVHQIDEKDIKIQRLRSQLNEERWHNRELRERQFYSTYHSRPIIIYNDPYNSLFWYWMLDRSIEQQALWAYHHRHSMDHARYNELLARNAELSARVRALETQNLPRDPAYVPTGMTDDDLMYNQQYVQAAYNPVEQPRQETKLDGGGSALIYFLVFAIIVVVLIFGWVIFVKRWQ